MPHLPPLTVFDVETTGLDPRRGHRVTELAGVRIEHGVLAKDAPFQSLVNPERPIPLEVQQITQITEQQIKDAPTMDQVLPNFLEFARGSILVAHNAEFDMGFLELEKQCCWGYVDLPECFCTMKMSQALFPHEFRHNLDVLALRLQLPIPTQRHRALTDVLLTAQALMKMIEIGKITSLDELRMKAGLKVFSRN